MAQILTPGHPSVHDRYMQISAPSVQALGYKCRKDVPPLSFLGHKQESWMPNLRLMDTEFTVHTGVHKGFMILHARSPAPMQRLLGVMGVSNVK